jgi:hypothetical protein
MRRPRDYNILPDFTMSTHTAHLYEVRPRKDKRGVIPIPSPLPFGRLWYSEPDVINNAIDHAKFLQPLA